jgi:hypothetical protein
MPGYRQIVANLVREDGQVARTALLAENIIAAADAVVIEFEQSNVRVVLVGLAAVSRLSLCRRCHGRAILFLE